MLNFSRWTTTLGVFPKWDNQKVPKIAHLGIFRHIGGVGGSKKMWTSKYSGSRSIVPKIAGIGCPGAPQYFFQKKTRNVQITVHLDIYRVFFNWKGWKITKYSVLSTFSSTFIIFSEKEAFLREFLCGIFWSQRCIWVSRQCAKSFRRFRCLVTICYA